MLVNKTHGELVAIIERLSALLNDLNDVQAICEDCYARMALNAEYEWVCSEGCQEDDNAG